MLGKLIRIPRLLYRSRAAARAAADLGGRGLEFNRFGVAIGRTLFWRGENAGLDYLLTPVSSTRYFEFPFVLAALDGMPHHCLDVGSPRLFSLFVASRFPDCRIDMINPDRPDIAITRQIAGHLRLRGIRAVARSIEQWDPSPPDYTHIWSISVVEHIAGEAGDTEAMKRMYGLLSEGGRLIVTVPVDRTFWEEYRERDVYRTGVRRTAQGYFFQRYYNLDSLMRRLVEPLGVEPIRFGWFGERERGRFHAYEERWMRQGHACTVDDPREMTQHYQEYPSWDTMPGVGVCGFVIQK